MKVVIDTRDIELMSASGYGLTGYFDENGNDTRFSKKDSDRERDLKAYEDDVNSGFLGKLQRCNTIEDINKAVGKRPYSLEIKEDKLCLGWTTFNGLYGEYTWKFKIIFADIQ